MFRYHVNVFYIKSLVFDSTYHLHKMHLHKNLPMHLHKNLPIVSQLTIKSKVKIVYLSLFKIIFFKF